MKSYNSEQPNKSNDSTTLVLHLLKMFFLPYLDFLTPKLVLDMGRNSTCKRNWHLRTFFKLCQHLCGFIWVQLCTQWYVQGVFVAASGFLWVHGALKNHAAKRDSQRPHIAVAKKEASLRHHLALHAFSHDAVLHERWRKSHF